MTNSSNTKTKWSANTRQKCDELIKQLRLPDTFQQIVETIYFPLAEIVMSNKRHSPLFISINGAQGTGKSTLTTFIKQIIESEEKCHVADLSLDDFYFTRQERKRLANTVHPLFVTRGVPGTHDINLLEDVVAALLSQEPCVVPRFDKARDDRFDRADWSEHNDPVDIVLFEGWCNHSPVQTEDDLAQAINELEEREDVDGIWRRHANDQLKEYHRRVFDNADMCIMLQAPDFENIYEWRLLQEEKLVEVILTGQQNQVMDTVALKRFIQHYERISRHTIKYLPASADVLLPIASDHSISGIRKKNE